MQGIHTYLACTLGRCRCLAPAATGCSCIAIRHGSLHAVAALPGTGCRNSQLHSVAPVQLLHSTDWPQLPRPCCPTAQLHRHSTHAHETLHASLPDYLQWHSSECMHNQQNTQEAPTRRAVHGRLCPPHRRRLPPLPPAHNRCCCALLLPGCYMPPAGPSCASPPSSQLPQNGQGGLPEGCHCWRQNLLVWGVGATANVAPGRGGHAWRCQQCQTIRANNSNSSGGRRQQRGGTAAAVVAAASCCCQASSDTGRRSNGKACYCT